MTEAINLVVKDAFINLDQNEIWAGTFENNLGTTHLQPKRLHFIIRRITAPSRATINCPHLEIWKRHPFAHTKDGRLFFMEVFINARYKSNS